MNHRKIHISFEMNFKLNNNADTETSSFLGRKTENNKNEKLTSTESKKCLNSHTTFPGTKMSFNNGVRYTR